MADVYQNRNGVIQLVSPNRIDYSLPVYQTEAEARAGKVNAPVVQQPAVQQPTFGNYNPQSELTNYQNQANQYRQRATGYQNQMQNFSWNQSNHAQQQMQSAMSNLQNFQFKDLAAIFKKQADALGLTQISADIASLMSQKNVQQRTLEDLPDTIKDAITGIGESITTAQLDRRAAQESRPIIRNISDLLNSISVLGTQYEQGLNQAKYSTELAGTQQQQQYNQLGDIFGMAQSQYSAALQGEQAKYGQLADLFSGATQQYGTAANQISNLFSTLSNQQYQQQNLAQEQSQFQQSQAQQESQFARQLAKPSGGSYSLAESMQLGQNKAQANLVNKLMGMGFGADTLSSNQKKIQSLAGDISMGVNYTDDQILKYLGLTKPTISQGGTSTLSKIGSAIRGGLGTYVAKAWKWPWEK